MRLMGLFGRLAIFASAVLAFAATPLHAEYPDQPITLIVPWGVGGGTDATGRTIASLLQKELGQPVHVINLVGNGGAVGHTAIATAAPDGYTIGVVTAELGMMHWAGLTKLRSSDFTAIALFNYDPAGLQVRADSPWKDAKDLLAAIRAEPGKHKASGTASGGIWHLALAGMLNKAGIEPDAALWVPSVGAAAGLQELLAGNVDIIPCSLVEAAALMKDGKVRSLAVMDEQRLKAFPDVPTIKEAAGVDWQMSSWRGIAGPKGLPGDITAKLIAAMGKIYKSKEFVDFMNQRGFGTVKLPGAEFAKWMAFSDMELGAVMKAVGIAK